MIIKEIVNIKFIENYNYETKFLFFFCNFIIKIYIIYFNSFIINKYKNYKNNND